MKKRAYILKSGFFEIAFFFTTKFTKTTKYFFRRGLRFCFSPRRKEGARRNFY